MHRIHNKIFAFFFLCFLLFPIYKVFPRDSFSNKLKTIIENAFKRNSQDEIHRFLEREISALSHANPEKAEAMEFLADYELRIEYFIEAAYHYESAAAFASGEKKKRLLLDSLKCFVLGNDTEKAFSVYNKIASLSASPKTNADKEALVCLEWLKIAENKNGAEQIQISVLKNLRNYITDPKFRSFHPAILLTLWWLDNDTAAKNTLMQLYPNHIETAAVNGDVLIKPNIFWYLMPKTENAAGALSKETENFAEESNSVRAEKNTVHLSDIPRAYQIGFFRNEQYANEQALKLRKKGFTVEIKKEKRQSGTVYFAVFVLEKQNGKTGIILKNEGYESFPVFD